MINPRPMLDTPRPLRLIQQPAYQARVERARERLAIRGLTARALAVRIGRSERCVYEVLGCVQPGRPTLALIEAELDRLAAEAPLFDGITGGDDE